MFFLVSLDTLILNVALPTIASELGGGMAEQQWVVDGYTLAFAVLLLLSGNLADRFGARRLFAVGTALFALASAACSLAPTMQALVAGRVALGAAAAAIMPSSMTLISEAFPGEAQRARALGVWMAGGAVAAAAGPLLGGVLTPIHWSLVFTVNVPVCVGVLAALPLVAASPRREAPFDWAGQALALVGLSCLVGGLIEGGDVGFGEPLPLALTACGAAALAAFAVSQGKVRAPMLPLSLFRSAGMRTALLAGFAFIMSWFGLAFLMSLYLQQVRGLDPLAAGLVFVPSAATAFAGNLASGRLTARFGACVPIAAGALVEAAGLVCLALFSSQLGAGALAAIVAVIGLGGSAMMPAASSLVLASAPDGQAGAASAAFNTFRQVGASIGIAAFGALASGLPRFEDAILVSFSAVTVLLALLIASAVRLARRRRR